MTLSGEALIGAMYINASEVASQRISLIEMGHPQLMTSMHTKNLDGHSTEMKIPIQ